jgi:hypothetical protein
MLGGDAEHRNAPFQGLFQRGDAVSISFLASAVNPQSVEAWGQWVRFPMTQALFWVEFLRFCQNAEHGQKRGESIPHVASKKAPLHRSFSHTPLVLKEAFPTFWKDFPLCPEF